jgi:hypothetical protein
VCLASGKSSGVSKMFKAFLYFGIFGFTIWMG